MYVGLDARSISELKDVQQQEVPLAGLLNVAFGRIRRQKQYARLFARGGSRAAELDRWLKSAAECIADLATPLIVLKAVPTRISSIGTEIAGRITLNDPRLSQDLSNGANVTAYLLTLGYSQEEAFKRLAHDYAVHHVQTDLASEVLFALGRYSYRMQKMNSAGRKVRQVPVLTSDLCGKQKTWDPKSVQSLIECFEEIDHGVSVTDSGCFRPLHSLLGLSVHL
ncbi:MAG: hypothetical protein K5905_23115 [Roseibium sp.]|uniref:hypothetical protein n=1 Tax=Roseibium sp. TaxID=1936156 RepID=UPI00260B02A6|nr:hypothetical protein [Roseibium sp.]MCV0428358.1 hypothetical protein [Roseibium sp.]